MKTRFLMLSLLFALQALFSQEPQSSLSRYCRDRICIFCTSDDARLVEETSAILLQAREEISRDLFYVYQDTLHVIIAPSRQKFKEFLHGKMPEWTQAFAMPSTGTMVVRSPRWDRPESSYRQSLVHELLHLLLHQHLGNRELPRWLEEGMAVFYAEHAEYENKSLLSRAMTTGSLIPLQAIDDVLQFQQSRAQLAYQQSYSAVRYLLATYDAEALRTILNGVASGEELDPVFVRATGSTVSEFEAEWHSYLEKTEKWLWLTEADELLWLALPFLFLIAVVFVRRRNRRRLAEWEASQRTVDWEALIPSEEGDALQALPPGQNSPAQDENPVAGLEAADPDDNDE
jgi:hypothetical protein